MLDPRFTKVLALWSGAATEVERQVARARGEALAGRRLAKSASIRFNTASSALSRRACQFLSFNRSREVHLSQTDVTLVSQYRRLAASLRGEPGFEQAVASLLLVFHEHNSAPVDERRSIVGFCVVFLREFVRTQCDQANIFRSDEEIEYLIGAGVTCALDTLPFLPFQEGHA